jgi:hypothetical protein
MSNRPCQVCATSVPASELEFDVQGRASCRSCRGHASALAANEELSAQGVLRRCRCGAGTLVQNQPTHFGSLQGGGIGGYSSAAITVGHRYQCDRCRRQVWFGAGTGIGVWLFTSLWLSVLALFIHKTSVPLWLTALVYGSVGLREAWLRHRYPKA